MKLQKNTIFKIVLLLLLVFSLAISVYLSRKPQKIEKKAGLEESILVTLRPPTNDPNNPWSPESSHLMEVYLTNTSSNNQNFRVAGVQVNFDSRVFTVNQESLSCNQPFRLLEGNASKVTADSVYIVCYLPASNSQGNNPYTLAPQETISVGSFSLTVKSDVPVNSSSLNFTYSNIPQESSLNNISYYNQETAAATFYLASENPSFPTATPNPTGTPTSTPTHSPQCGNGDINLDGKVSELDISLLIQNWRPEGPAPTPRPGFCSYDLNNDGRISEFDILEVIKHWNPD